MFRTTISGTTMESTLSGRAAGGSLVLVGRDRECGAIEELFAGALAGESQALIVRGEPGIGKSALLDYAAARADGMELLTTAGVEAEAISLSPACTDCCAGS